MRKTILLSAFGFLFLGSANAAKIESIYLDKQTQYCVNSMGLDFSIHTERIKEDKEKDRASGTSYWINPFRNIDRMIAAQLQHDGYVPCLDKYLRFRNDALDRLNNEGVIPVYGYSLKSLNYFLQSPDFVFGAFK